MAFPGTFYSPYGGGGAPDPRNNYGSPYGGAAAPPAPPPNSSALPNYNVNPPPTGGNGPYGLVPGAIPIPPSTWQQTIGAVPALGNTTQLTNNIMSELQGDINPQALKNMQDAAASYGVSSGMPGSNAIPGTLAFNKNLRNIGLDTLQVQSQGLKDYLSTLAGIGGQQTPQGLAAEIAAHNAQLRAAPDPQAAAERQLANYWNALNALRGPGGGTGQGPGPQGGTGTLAPQALGFGFGGFPGLTGAQAQPPPNYAGSGDPFYDFWDLGQNVGGGATTGGSTFGSSGDPFYDFWDQGTPVNPGGVNYDQGGGGFGVGYDQSAPPDFTGLQNYMDENAFYGG